jgi:citrate lyase subunit beta/citryl-CoA lyase
MARLNLPTAVIPIGRLRRTELTCPAHSRRMMEKAAASQADEVIFDLEDACAPSQKIAARLTLIEALRTLEFSAKVVALRPNGVHTGLFYRDLIEVVEAAGQRLDTVVLPKVQSPDDVRFADRLLTQIEQSSGLAPGRIRLEVLIESAAGLLAAGEIARASPRMDSLIFGVADYAGDVGMRRFQDDSSLFLYPRAHIVAAAKSAGLQAIDSVTVQYKDLERCRAEAEAAARMGFDGKWAIHPDQLEPINGAFTPSREELARALALFETYAAADAERGTGAITEGDEMIDAASLRVEWNKIEIGRRAGLLDSSDRLVP